MADAGARRHGGEILEALGAPLEEVVPLRIAGVFEFHVGFHRLGMAEFVDHHRVVDDEVHRNLRVDLLRVAAQRLNRVAHRGEVDHAGHAGEVLQEHARGAVLDFAAGHRIVDPVRDFLRIVDRDRVPAVFEAQHVLQQHLEAEGQTGNIAQLLRRLGERVVGVILAFDGESAAGTESVLADLGHSVGGPFMLLLVAACLSTNGRDAGMCREYVPRAWPVRVRKSSVPAKEGCRLRVP